MERLLIDANNLDSSLGLVNEEGKLTSYTFADIVKAINVVQTEMGITGTTALEAGRTISGSVGAMKSAWTNLVTGLADGNADIGQLVDNLVTTIVGDGTESNLGVLGNVMPAVKTALSGASKLVSELLPKIVQEIPSIINDNLPILAEAAISIIQSLVDGISQNKEILFDTIFSVIEYISVSFIEMLPEIVQLGLDMILSLIEGILDATPILLDAIAGMFTDGQLVSKILDAIISLIEILITNIGPIVQKIIEIVPIITESVNQALLENFPALLQGIITLVLEIIRNLPSLVSMLVDQIGPIVSTIVQIIVENAPAFLMGIAQIVFEIVKAIPSLLASVGRSIMQVFSGIGTGLVNAWPKFKEGLNQIWVKMKDWFSSLGSKFIEIGSNIVDGIKRGISNAWKNLKTWFKNLFGDLIGIAKKILGIASPSKVFKGIGQFTAEGFGIGFEKEFDKVKSDIEKAMIFDNIEIGASIDRNIFYGSTNGGYGGKNGGTISIVQNIYSQAQTAADLMQEAIYQQEKAVLLGV